MRRQNDTTSQALSSFKPTRLNLQTRPFAPSVIQEQESLLEAQDNSLSEKLNFSENILAKLINSPKDESNPVVQRKSENRLKTKAVERKIAIQAKQQMGGFDRKSEVVQEISSTKQHQSIQRLLGADGTAQKDEKVPITFNEELFVKKHVGDNTSEAKAKTEARIASGVPAGLRKGNIANSVAPISEWEKTINASKVKVPPEDDWGAKIECFDDDRQHVKALTSVVVQGWEAKVAAEGSPVTVSSKKALSKIVGGYWEISGSEVDDENEHQNPDETEVTFEVDHCGDEA